MSATRRFVVLVVSVAVLALLGLVAFVGATKEAARQSRLERAAQELRAAVGELRAAQEVAARQLDRIESRLSNLPTPSESRR